MQTITQNKNVIPSFLHFLSFYPPCTWLGPLFIGLWGRCIIMVPLWQVSSSKIKMKIIISKHSFSDIWQEDYWYGSTSSCQSLEENCEWKWFPFVLLRINFTLLMVLVMFLLQFGLVAHILHVFTARPEDENSWGWSLSCARTVLPNR